MEILADMDIIFNNIFFVFFILKSIPGYIDPGSASALMAMIIGAIAGAGMTIKLYWFKIKEKISRN
tara:strand:- start:546 stop:743 length:198 start_codon:yes stop_codon:yes gene_type:complete